METPSAARYAAPTSTLYVKYNDTLVENPVYNRQSVVFLEEDIASITHVPGNSDTFAGFDDAAAQNATMFADRTVGHVAGELFVDWLVGWLTGWLVGCDGATGITYNKKRKQTLAYTMHPG